MASIGRVDAVEVARERLKLVVTVTRVHEFRLRVWLVSRLLALVAWVSPVPVDVEMRDREG
jgi:hypothetical protein